MKSKESIENALGLPTEDELKHLLGIEDEKSDDDMIITQEELSEMQNTIIELKKMRTQLKDLPDVTKKKNMLNMLADRAEEAFEEIFRLATLGTEPRFVSEMVNSASSILKIALDAHAKVIESDIKLIDLQIKKDKMEFDMNVKAMAPQKIDNQEIKDVSGTDRTDDDEVVFFNRNQILSSKNNNK